MINIVIMNDAGTDGYASVFEVNKNNYFARIFEHDNEIICTITRLGEEIIVDHQHSRFEMEDEPFYVNKEALFVSPTSLAGRIEDCFKEKVNWIFLNENGEL
ncbi:MAG: hypothetical protein IJ193_00605 [Bacilli bacterium]|nr:hypothetical protein [Bacilli bacterium]